MKARAARPGAFAGVLAALLSAPLAGQTITTVAGTGENRSAPDGSPAATSPLALAMDSVVNVVFDADGNMVFSEGRVCRVRRVVKKTGLLETLAGNGRCSYSGDGGPATRASLRAPAEVAFDRDGNLWIADSQNQTLRRVDKATGIIETVVGTKRNDFNGDGVGRAVALGRPSGLTLDPQGRIVVADTANTRLRRVDPKTLAVETIAGTGELLYLGDRPARTAGFAWPNSPRFAPDGSLFFAATGNNRILRLDPKGEVVTSYAGTGMEGETGDGGPAAQARFTQPASIAVDRAGNVFVCDTGNNAIRRIDAKTHVVTHVAGAGKEGFSGDGGPAAAATFFNPLGLGLDANGDLYVVDATNMRIRRIAGVGAR